jgi:hypothetical protein
MYQRKTFLTSWEYNLASEYKISDIISLEPYFMCICDVMGMYWENGNVINVGITWDRGLHYIRIACLLDSITLPQYNFDSQLNSRHSALPT